MFEGSAKQAGDKFTVRRQLVVQGFSILLALENGKIKTISHGFQDYEHLKANLDDWLAETAMSVRASGPSCTDDSCSV